MDDIGTVLASARKAAGLQQKQLANELGISATYLCDIELGRKPLRVRHLELLPSNIRKPVAKAMLENRQTETRRIEEAAQ